MQGSEDTLTLGMVRKAFAGVGEVLQQLKLLFPVSPSRLLREVYTYIYVCVCVCACVCVCVCVCYPDTSHDVFVLLSFSTHVNSSSPGSLYACICAYIYMCVCMQIFPNLTHDSDVVTLQDYVASCSQHYVFIQSLGLLSG
jgi:hypothetical protein